MADTTFGGEALWRALGLAFDPRVTLAGPPQAVPATDSASRDAELLAAQSKLALAVPDDGSPWQVAPLDPALQPWHGHWTMARSRYSITGSPDDLADLLMYVTWECPPLAPRNVVPSPPGPRPATRAGITALALRALVALALIWAAVGGGLLFATLLWHVSMP
jgi:hypothetical protein